MRIFQSLVLISCCLFSCNNAPKQQEKTTIATDAATRDSQAQTVLKTQRLGDGIYCFETYNSPGYEYLTFAVAAGRITNGSGDGYSESEEASWSFSFTGFFEKDGTIQVEVRVENESGVQAPRLETWKVVDNDLLMVNKGKNREVTYKKITCK